MLDAGNFKRFGRGKVTLHLEDLDHDIDALLVLCRLTRRPTELDGPKRIS